MSRWRYVFYWLGVKYGSPLPGTHGKRHEPLDYTEWISWFRRGS